MRDQKKFSSFDGGSSSNKVVSKSLKMERKFTKEIMCDVGCGNMRVIRQYAEEDVEPHEQWGKENDFCFAA